MLTIIGILTIVVIVALLISEKTSPIIPLVIIPIIGALLAGFSFVDLNKFYLSGLKSVMQIAVTFIFAILFFGIMNDAGLFRPIINFLVKVTGGNVIAVTLSTVIISVIAHLDGAGASTFLLVLPPLLPLYKRLKMSPYLLFLLLAASAGLTNLLPWGGPTGRVATVLGADLTTLYKPLIPVQIIGTLVILVFAIFLGIRERSRILHKYGNLDPLNDVEDIDNKISIDEETNLLKPKLVWINLGLFILTMALLVTDTLKSGYIFMIATSLALIINYPKPQMQLDMIVKHAGGAIMMATIIIAAGTFLGILRDTGMLNAIAASITTILPDSIAKYLHIIIGVLGVPFELILSTDAYYFGLLPVVEKVTTSVGVLPYSTGYALLIGSIVGTFVSPFSPALWMGLGLAKLSMGKHIRYSFFWIWAISVIILIIAIIIGVVA